MGEEQTPELFSLGSAVDALDDMFRALSKPKQREYLGNFNEIAVVLTGVAGLLGVVRDSPEWRLAVGNLTLPATRSGDAD